MERKGKVKEEGER